MKKLITLTAACLMALTLLFGCDFPGAKKKSGKGDSAKAESKIHLPDKNNIVVDKETGLQVEKDVIVITFSKFIGDSTIKTIVQEVGGEIVGFQNDSNFFQVRLPGADLAKSKEACLKLLSEHKDVEYAVPNTVSKAENPYWNSGDDNK